MKTVSVIISIYNGEKYIENLVKMCKNQTYKNVEYIFIDDGSNDKTLDKLNNIKIELENYTVLHKINGGVSSGRNMGIKNARGEYVIFSDVDDRWEPEYIEGLVLAMNNHEQLVISGYYCEDQVGNLLYKYSSKNEIVSIDTAICECLSNHRANTALWNKIFSRYIIDKYNILFDESLTIGEDMDFIIRYCTKIDKVKIISNYLYTYILNPNGAMQIRKKANYFSEKWLSEWSAVKKVKKILKENNYKYSLRRLEAKEVGVADKILKLMIKFNYSNNSLEIELLRSISINWKVYIEMKDVLLKAKIPIIFYVICPKLRNVIVRFKTRKES